MRNFGTRYWAFGLYVYSVLILGGRNSNSTSSQSANVEQYYLTANRFFSSLSLAIVFNECILTLSSNPIRSANELM
jgi:hypothetical protein